LAHLKLGSPRSAAQFLDEFLFRIAEQDGAHAGSGLGNEHRAKDAVAELIRHLVTAEPVGHL
jgi:hypothetical protein